MKSGCYAGLVRKQMLRKSLLSCNLEFPGCASGWKGLRRTTSK